MSAEISSIASDLSRAALWRAEVKAMLALGVPLALSQLAQIAIQTTDVVLLGWLGAEPLAAAGLATNVWVIMFLFGLGVASAVSPIVAQIVGHPDPRGKVRRVRRVVRQGFWAATLLAIPFMAVCWHIQAILLFFDQDPKLAAMAEPFLRALMWATLPALWFVVLRCFVSAFERTRAVLAVTVCGILFNATINYGLIFGHFGLPQLGLLGAGIGSAVTHSSMTLIMLTYVLRDRRFRRYYILGRLWRPDWRTFREIFRIGLPIGSMWVLEVGVFTAALLLMGLIGTTAIAAHQIALQCAAITFMVPLGMSMAATVRVGLAVGGGDLRGVRRAGFTAQGLGVGFMAMSCLLFILAGPHIVGLFLDSSRPDSLPVSLLAAQLLAVAGIFQMFDGAQAVAAGALRGMKDTRMPLVIALVGYWLIAFPLGVTLAFPFKVGAIGIWMGLAVGLAIAAVLLTLRFDWLTRRPLAQVTA
ncbi:MAG TPA: MATE family efflux transporter [Alphaproteobacteria bacterium]|jgi:MATE family multidrug resistance protein